MNDVTYDHIIRRLEHSLPAPPPACLHEFPGPLNLPLDLLPVPLERLRPAAVLVPIVRDPSGPRMLLTQRNAQLRHHGGQISFPGGGAEAEPIGMYPGMVHQVVAANTGGWDWEHAHSLLP